MKCWDYEAVVIDGAVYCTECAPKTYKDSAGKRHKYAEEDISPIFADSEWDSFPVCDVCQKEHTYMSLTTAGVRERLEMLRAKWRRIYDAELDPIADEIRDLASDGKTDADREKETLEEERDDWKARALTLADMLEKRAGSYGALTPEEFSLLQEVGPA